MLCRQSKFRRAMAAFRDDACDRDGCVVARRYAVAQPPLYSTERWHHRSHAQRMTLHLLCNTRLTFVAYFEGVCVAVFEVRESVASLVRVVYVNDEPAAYVTPRDIARRVVQSDVFDEFCSRHSLRVVLAAYVMHTEGNGHVVRVSTVIEFGTLASITYERPWREGTPLRIYFTYEGKNHEIRVFPRCPRNMCEVFLHFERRCNESDDVMRFAVDMVRFSAPVLCADYAPASAQRVLCFRLPEMA